METSHGQTKSQEKSENKQENKVGSLERLKNEL
jgi:hypothetical protein